MWIFRFLFFQKNGSRFFDFRGFGLVESVIVAGVGMTLGLGVLKITQVSINTAQVSGTILSEQRLKKSIYNLLGDPKECAFNLKPSRLSDKANKNGEIAKLINTGGNNIDQNHDTSDDTILITSGESFGDGLIRIIKIELIDPDTTNNNSKERTFKLYYTKPRLAEFSTIAGRACSKTDSSGCYTISCKMDYHCEDANGDCLPTDDPKNKCQPLDCLGDEGGGGGNGINCGTNEYSKGLKENGNPECEPLSCLADKIFMGLKEDGTPNCVSVNDSIRCLSSGEFFRGFDSSGKIICVNKHQVCSGGRTYESGSCTCPSRKQFDFAKGMCVCKSSLFTWSEAEKKCKCTNGGVYHEVSNVCRTELCPSNTPQWNGTSCEACPSSTPVWNGSSCDACPSSAPSWNGSSCTACSSSTPLWNGTSCTTCPSGTPQWNGTSCTTCPSGTPQWNGTSCTTCPSGTPQWNGTSCTTCPSGTPLWNGSQCEPCPPSTPKWNIGRSLCEACHSSTPQWNSSRKRCEPCPSNRPWWNTSSRRCAPCPSGTKWSSSTVRCELKEKCRNPSYPYWTGSRCITCAEHNSATPYWNSSIKRCTASP